MPNLNKTVCYVFNSIHTHGIDRNTKKIKPKMMKREWKVVEWYEVERKSEQAAKPAGRKIGKNW